VKDVASEVAGHDDWDQHWMGMAHSASRNPAQAMRRRLVRALLAAGPGARILDVGCGQGDLVAQLRRSHPDAELSGLDYSQFGVDVARSKVPGARFEQRDLLQPGEPSADMAGWATHAVCSEVLEHVDDPELLLVNARAYLAPGCRLVITVPGGPMSAFDRHIGHRRHFTPATLRETLAAAGFEVDQVSGAGFPFFNLYRSVVILRGERMVDDAGGTGATSPSPAARAAMAVFRPLLAVPAPRNRLGWQVVGVARIPAG
jgi:2-polyprenyl-3-methyl-5-hydroxy-6-metoxy-1,4-benzoquinol methylase